MLWKSSLNKYQNKDMEGKPGLVESRVLSEIRYADIVQCPLPWNPLCIDKRANTEIINSMQNSLITETIPTQKHFCLTGIKLLFHTLNTENFMYRLDKLYKIQ